MWQSSGLGPAGSSDTSTVKGRWLTESALWKGKQRSLEFEHDYILPTVASLRAEKGKRDNSVTLSRRSRNREQACKVVHVSSSQIS